MRINTSSPTPPLPPNRKDSQPPSDQPDQPQQPGDGFERGTQISYEGGKFQVKVNGKELEGMPKNATLAMVGGGTVAGAGVGLGLGANAASVVSNTPLGLLAGAAGTYALMNNTEVNGKKVWDHIPQMEAKPGESDLQKIGRQTGNVALRGAAIATSFVVATALAPAVVVGGLTLGGSALGAQAGGLAASQLFGKPDAQQ